MEETPLKGWSTWAAISAGHEGRRLMMPLLSREIEIASVPIPLPGAFN